MKSSKIIYPIVLTFILLGASNCFLYKSAEKKDSVALQYKLKEGQTVVVNSKIVSKFETEQMGQTITVDMNSNTVLANKVKSVGEDGSLEMELEFREMSQSMNSSMGSGETDYSKLIGKKVAYKINGLGIGSDMAGFKDLPDITTVNGETISGEMYETVVEGTFFELPDHPVKIGDTWTNENTSEMPYGGGSLKTDSKTIYIITKKLEVDGEECYEIDVTGTAKTAGEFEQNGMQLSMDRNSTSSGTMIFAYNKGMYLSMDMTSKTEGLIDVPAAGMTIPQTITSTTNTKVSFE